MIWDSWEKTGLVLKLLIDRDRTRDKKPVSSMETGWRRRTTDVIEETLRTTREFGTRSEMDDRTIVTEQFDQWTIGDRVVSRDLIPFMRSRNVEFVSKKMKPLTRMYGFFDGVDVTKYCVPKIT